MGTIRSPATFGFIICAPNVGLFIQPKTLQLSGQALPLKFNQCFFHVPQLQLLLDVPDLLDQPFAVKLKFYTFPLLVWFWYLF